MQSIAVMELWVGFFIFIACVFALNLLLLNGRKSHDMQMRQAAGFVLVWVASALVFNLALWFWLDQTQGHAIANQKSLEFLTGYLLEELLSFDNMFVIFMIFQFFAVPTMYQRRVLLYGVLGAIVMRILMILAGLELIHAFHWILYLLGVFLIYTGIKMFVMADKTPDLSENRLLIWLRRHLPVTDTFHGERFFIRQHQKWLVTPLLITLIFVEISDLVFALDSIPAIFAVTRDAFIVLTSNIFAILGLRSIYFLLANMARRFEWLKYGIALILIIVGVKIAIEHWIRLPVWLMPGVVVTILFISIIFSWVKKRR